MSSGSNSSSLAFVSTHWPDLVPYAPGKPERKWGYLASMHGSLSLIPSTNQVYTCKPSLWKVEARRSEEVQGHSQKQRAFKSVRLQEILLGVRGAGDIPYEDQLSLCLQREFQGRSLNHGNPNLVSGF